MKLLIIISILLISLTSFANNVEGELFYTMPNGDLVTRNVTMTVPSRGEGSVTLSGESFKWETENFWSEKTNNETFFYAVFKTSFQKFKSTIIFKGTYLKGTNKIMYYGSMYKKDGHHDVDKDLSGFDYSGGFNFNFNR